MQVSWVKCEGDVWCLFDNVDLTDVATEGVYVIWHGGENPHAVYVGQGDVAERIEDHRTDLKITRHRDKGKLFVTWASVSIFQRDGVERYLANELFPLEGEHHPQATPLAVNLPK